MEKLYLNNAGVEWKHALLFRACAYLKMCKSNWLAINEIESEKKKEEEKNAKEKSHTTHRLRNTFQHYENIQNLHSLIIIIHWF